ncbi:HDOD domain-containing protein [Herbaspirillum lusitanum]|uniref:HDOD domain-containing protein n=1 Tax=Herbaspirillum lusitanum TaxID=213312 RepID=UPI0002EC5E4B|nr:HDOD domain-containing protein [Herbaspirillum lusitanum]
MPNFIDPTDFEALKQDDALPSPSGVRLNIMRMCRQEDVSLVELVTQIQADPVLGGRIIKIGNGASINKGRPIVAISKDVLLMIGLDAVRQVRQRPAGQYRQPWPGRGASRRLCRRAVKRRERRPWW